MTETATFTRDTAAVRNGVDATTLFATLDAIKAQPEIAEFRFRASTRWLGGSHHRSTIKDFYAACGEDYGDRAETLQLAAPLYAPRRTVLATTLLSAAVEAGAQARFGAVPAPDRAGHRRAGQGARRRRRDVPGTAHGRRRRAALDGGPAGRCPDGAPRHRGERDRVRLLAGSVGLALRLVLPARGERGDHPDQ